MSLSATSAAAMIIVGPVTSTVSATVEALEILPAVSIT
ncbi:hypothetical protein MNB_SUP05-10-206 [hydrothermal vent metagenome]|uniref:Uncharacterized protein n=1 Tax=hydrothermal vent metagenome TaxID=652676 RepID=A0A1W1D609_9ZZZZ